MIPSEIIEKKRDGISLNRNEIKWFINSLIKNQIDTAQLSALLMAIYFKGMNDEETFSLVEAMVESGEKFDFNYLNSYVADKHSTGGIGDKVSFILAPILSSLGIVIPMIAGRGLAYTGGTIDKLKSIPNLETSLSLKNIKNQIETIGCCIASQSSQICPADKTLYSIRDLTGTVPSLPLICSSIMSKKIAEGLNGLVMDIKVGNGTFMKTMEEAKTLGSKLKKIGDTFNINTELVYSNMNQPLGNFAGLQCEILESIECLKGNGPKDIMEITFELGSKILLQSKTAKNIGEAKQLMLDTIKNRNALNKFEEIINAQNADFSSYIAEPLIPKYEIIINSHESGFISNLETEKIGWSLVEMGCGRKVEKDELDYTSGIEFLNKIGDKVKKGETIFRIFGNSLEKLNNAKKILDTTYTLTDSEVTKPKLIITA